VQRDINMLSSVRKGGPLVRSACFFSALLLVGPAFGHGGGHGEKNEDIVAVLDKLPAALQSVKVELHKTLASQLVIENKTDKLLEILDADGAPFLRIGPDKVQANLAAAAWYRTYTETGIPIPAAAKEKNAAPKWSAVSKTPAWGWFDLRLRSEDIRVPHGVADARRTATVGQWKIPVHFDGKPTALTGVFRYMPRPSGRFEARLTGGGEISPGISVQILPGPVPGFFVTNTSRETLTVFGRANEPLVRIGPEGVYANVKSPTWQQSGQAEVSYEPMLADAKAAPQWVLRSPSPRFSWIDVRAAYPQREPPAAVVKRGARAEVQRWTIPMQHGQTELKVTGATDWIPVSK